MQPAFTHVRPPRISICEIRFSGSEHSACQAPKDCKEERAACRARNQAHACRVELRSKKNHVRGWANFCAPGLPAKQMIALLLMSRRIHPHLPIEQRHHQSSARSLLLPDFEIGTGGHKMLTRNIALRL